MQVESSGAPLIEVAQQREPNRPNSPEYGSQKSTASGGGDAGGRVMSPFAFAIRNGVGARLEP